MLTLGSSGRQSSCSPNNAALDRYLAWLVPGHKAYEIRISYTQHEPAIMQIIVRDNNVDQALRALKKKLQREGVYREMKLRRHYEKPSEKRAREHAAAVSRARKADRKRAERDN
jgi:small subunit ribosomal protein S21